MVGTGTHLEDGEITAPTTLIFRQRRIQVNRRTLLSQLAAVGLVLATPEPVRRFWQLDRDLMRPPWDRQDVDIIAFNLEVIERAIADGRFPAWNAAHLERQRHHIERAIAAGFKFFPDSAHTRFWAGWVRIYRWPAGPEPFLLRPIDADPRLYVAGG